MIEENELFSATAYLIDTEVVQNNPASFCSIYDLIKHRCNQVRLPIECLLPFTREVIEVTNIKALEQNAHIYTHTYKSILDYGCINKEYSFKFSCKTTQTKNQSSTSQLPRTILSLTTLKKRVYYYRKGYFRRSKKSVYIRKDIFKSIEFRTLNYVKKSNNKNQSVLLQICDISEAQ